MNTIVSYPYLMPVWRKHPEAWECGCRTTLTPLKVKIFREGICVIYPLGAVARLTTYNGLGSRRNTKQQKAFELIVVMSMVVIITMLAGVSVPQYLAHNRRAEVV